MFWTYRFEETDGIELTGPLVVRLTDWFDNFQNTMRWLQYTLFLLARSIEAENGSGFHLSCLDLWLTLVKLQLQLMLLYLGLRTLWLSAQERQWKKMQQEKPVKAIRYAVFQMSFSFLHPGFAGLHSRPRPAFSVQWTRGCWGGRGEGERWRRLHHPAKVTDGVKNMFAESIRKVRKIKIVQHNILYLQ